MKKIAKLTVAMGLCCGIASVVLAVADQATRQARQVAEKRDKMTALAQVLPTFDPKAELEEKRFLVKDASGQEREVIFHLLRKADGVVGLAGECSTTRGYGGRIHLLAGITDEGKIRAIVVMEHRETPGLGAILLERQARKTLSDAFHAGKEAGAVKALPPCPYLDQYNGRSLDGSVQFKVQKAAAKISATTGATKTYRAATDAGQAIDAVTGATITSRAVADAIQSLADAFAAHREELR